jgi:hypothetical protein
VVLAQSLFEHRHATADKVDATAMASRGCCHRVPPSHAENPKDLSCIKLKRGASICQAKSNYRDGITQLRLITPPHPKCGLPSTECWMRDLTIPSTT